MAVEQTSATGPTPDRLGLGAWENEGGCLEPHGPDAMAAEAPLPGEDGTPRWIRAVSLSDLPDEGAIHLDLHGVPLCLARSEGTVHALLDECSHGQVALSEGDVADGVVECWLHGSCFDLVTGVPTGPPAIVPVPVYPVRIVANEVEIALQLLE